jgi:hypothetical protein
MVEPVAGLAAWLKCFEPPHPQEILLEGLTEGRFKRFNVASLNGREEIFTKLNNLFYNFTSYPTSNAPKTIELRLPHASRSLHLPSILPSIPDAYFWLVVVWEIIDRQPPKAKAPPISLFFSSVDLVTPNDGMMPPHAIKPGPSSSPRSPLLWPLTDGDCCVSLSDGGRLRPRPRPSLFFSLFHFVAPNNGAAPPKANQPSRASSPTSLLLQLPTVS